MIKWIKGFFVNEKEINKIEPHVTFTKQDSLLIEITLNRIKQCISDYKAGKLAPAQFSENIKKCERDIDTIILSIQQNKR